jgi:hypothetical protein
MGRGEATTWQQRHCILEWLEVRENFQLITGGTPPGPVVAGKKLKKTDAYKALAEYVNLKLGYAGPPNFWDGTKSKSKYESLLTKYKTTRAKYVDRSGAKFALSEEDLFAGKTIDAKLEEECVDFKRWDALFGERQNVNPSFTYESGSFELDDSDEDSDLDEERIVIGLSDPASTAVFINTVSTQSLANSATDPEIAVKSASNITDVAAVKIGNVKKTATQTPAFKVHPVLAKLSEAVSSDGSSGDSKQSSKKAKTDLHSSFTEAKLAQVQLERERFEYEKASRISVVDPAKETTRKEILLALLKDGKSTAEIKTILADLGY